MGVFGLRILSALIDVLSIALTGLFVAFALGEANTSTSRLFGFVGSWFFASGGGIAFLLLMAIIFLRLLISGIYLRASSIFFARVVTHQANLISEHLFGLEPRRLQEFSRGEVHWLLTSSVSIAFNSNLVAFLNLLGEGGFALILLVAFASTNIGLTAILISAFFLLILAYQLLIGRFASSLGRRLRRMAVGMNDQLLDLLETHRELILADSIGSFRIRLDGVRQRFFEAQASQKFWLGIPRLVVEGTLIVGLASFAGFQALTSFGMIDLASLSLFLIGSLRLVASVVPVQTSITELRINGHSASRANEVIAQLKAERASEGQNETTLPSRYLFDESNESCSPPAIKIRDTTLRFQGAPEAVVSNISLDIEPGEFHALVGPSGAGKTTVAELIAGLQSPSHGRLEVGGKPASQYYKQRPGLVGYVPQQSRLFRGTIAQNVSLNLRPDTDMVERVLRTLHSVGLGQAFPDVASVTTELNGQIDSLSGGEIQRIGLARALLREPKLLILDEFTSALDVDTEGLLTSNLKALKGSMTLVVVAHRLSTIRNADRISFVDRGKILKTGTHKQMVAGLPQFARYVSQISHSEEDSGEPI